MSDAEQLAALPEPVQEQSLSPVGEQALDDQDESTYRDQTRDSAEHVRYLFARGHIREVGVVGWSSQEVEDGADAGEAQEHESAADIPVHGGKVATMGAA